VVYNFQRAIDILCPCGVQVSVRDKDWIETKKMNAFLTVAKGSCETPLFLEMGYCAGNTEDKPVVLTGQYNLESYIQ
jgi:aminopeptidase